MIYPWTIGTQLMSGVCWVNYFSRLFLVKPSYGDLFGESIEGIWNIYWYMFFFFMFTVNYFQICSSWFSMVESNVVHDSDCSTVLTLIIVPFASLCRALMCWKGVPESAGSFKYRLGFACYLGLYLGWEWCDMHPISYVRLPEVWHDIFRVKWQHFLWQY